MESGGSSGDRGIREALRAAAERAPAATAPSASAIADERPAGGEELRAISQRATAIERRIRNTDLERRLNQPADGHSQPEVEVEGGPR